MDAALPLDPIEEAFDQPEAFPLLVAKPKSFDIYSRWRPVSDFATVDLWPKQTAASHMNFMRESERFDSLKFHKIGCGSRGEQLGIDLCLTG